MVLSLKKLNTHTLKRNRAVKGLLDREYWKAFHNEERAISLMESFYQTVNFNSANQREPLAFPGRNEPGGTRLLRSGN